MPKRTRRLEFWVNDQEHDQAAQNSQEDGIGISEYMRNLVRDDTIRRQEKKAPKHD